jgi:hypothetical protein
MYYIVSSVSYALLCAHWDQIYREGIYIQTADIHVRGILAHPHWLKSCNMFSLLNTPIETFKHLRLIHFLFLMNKSKCHSKTVEASQAENYVRILWGQFKRTETVLDYNKGLTSIKEKLKSKGSFAYNIRRQRQSSTSIETTGSLNAKMFKSCQRATFKSYIFSSVQLCEWRARFAAVQYRILCARYLL